VAGARRFASVSALFLVTGAAIAVRLAARIACSAIWAKTTLWQLGIRMKTLTAKGAKCCFGRLIDLVRGEPSPNDQSAEPATRCVRWARHSRILFGE
jgi:hypothetical protein